MSVDRAGSAGVADETRGVICGGSEESTRTDICDFITIQTEGTADNFGDLITPLNSTAGCADSTRGCIGGGRTDATVDVAAVSFITIQSEGDAETFGDLTEGRNLLAGLGA